MQDGISCDQYVRAMVTLSGALAGLIIILIGGFIPAAIVLPNQDFSIQVLSLPSTWQVPSVLLCALVCGPRAGVIASIAYITIGLFQLPVFHGGGSVNYLLTPGFGYLAGFVPAAWLSGRLAQQDGMNDFVSLSFSALAGLLLLQVCGIINLILGSLTSRWAEQLPEMLFRFTLGPLPAQIALCAGVGIIALPLRLLLFIK